MKSCLGMLVAVVMILAVLGALGGIYYLSSSSVFTLKESTGP